MAGKLLESFNWLIAKINEIPILGWVKARKSIIEGTPFLLLARINRKIL